MNTHKWSSVVVNLRHIYECQKCGKRLNPNYYGRLPIDGCPGR
jgi:hypothetical protein